MLKIKQFLHKHAVGIAILISAFCLYHFLDSGNFYYAPKSDTEFIVGFELPDESKLLLRENEGAYRIYKWAVPPEFLSTFTLPNTVSKSPFHELEWRDREFYKFSDGAERLIDEEDFPVEAQSIRYRTSHYAVELITSTKESSIMVLGIYNN